MTTYFLTRKRDGQASQKMFQLEGSTLEEATKEFSERMLRSIAEGDDYMHFSSEADLKEMFPDYDWKGEGYYLLPDGINHGREEFYASDARFDSYYEDVYRYAIEEIENPTGDPVIK